ncbi:MULTISPECIES: hypothetical protein [unclassified Streptomyces]|uniref:hypothetical protein n=1 Tax=unclassified Streptomyces TaxID=2593676 RepID=UPI00331710AD
MATVPAPGEGTVRPVSVSLHEGTIAALVERDRLRELIEDAEADHGPVGQSAVDAKRAILRGETAGPADAA